MSVTLREKTVKNGQVSFYLDIYHNKRRWYEFLNIHVQKQRPSFADKEKRRLAQECRAKREHELIVQDKGLVDKTKIQGCFVAFTDQYFRARRSNGMYYGANRHLQRFAQGRPIPFSHITATWIKALETYLLQHLSNNSTIRYLKAINSAINEAIRKGHIQRSPWLDIPQHQRLKMKDVFRTAFTIDQLQHLAGTPCTIDPQIRQAYLFSCFTGLRWSDVNKLRWDEVIIQQSEQGPQYYLYYEQEKTEGIEYLPLSENAVEIIQAREQVAAKEEKSVYVFAGIRDEAGKKSNYQRTRLQLKKWAIAAGIDPKKLHFHTGRHSFATNLLESTSGDLYTVSKLLGHRDIKATQIYAKVRDKRKLEAVRALPKIAWTAHTA